MEDDLFGFLALIAAGCEVCDMSYRLICSADAAFPFGPTPCTSYELLS
jgi:hypothetical protein